MALCKPNADDALMNLQYPYQTLQKLTDSLWEYEIPSIHEQMEQLFGLLDISTRTDSHFPDFFSRCILFDILTILGHSMTLLNTRSKSYSNLYFITLHLCQNYPYAQKKEEIQKNILSLLEIYMTESIHSTVHISQIREIMLREYNSPDFSISMLADIFHISVGHMSYLFKKNFHENFSDYLWKLRMEKAKELLLETNLVIDQISSHTGYLNTSSFRRKFKHATGLTPSQFRGEDPQQAALRKIPRSPL